MSNVGITRVWSASNCGLALALACIMVPAPTAAGEVPAAVTLSGQRVRVDEAGRTLEVEVMVHDDLDVALTAVEVGWLLAPSVAALQAVSDPGALYLAADDPKHARAPEAVTVLRRNVTAWVPAHGSAPARFAVGLTPGAETGAPEVYRTHVLGFALADDAALPLLLRLLHGSAAADERAAVDFFGLAGSAAERLGARAKRDAVTWTAALSPRALAPIPERPSATELHERLFVVRALGVVGGGRAEEALATLRDRTDCASLDELLRVALIDRLRGNRLETPLAFAVPSSARSFRDVVEAALADAKKLPELAAAEIRQPTTDDRPPITDQRTPTTDDRHPTAEDRPPPERAWWPQVAGLAVAAAAAMLTLLVLRRRT